MRLWKTINTELLLGFALAACLSQGCSIGASKGYCEKNGCNYREAGVCRSAFDVLANREETIERTYKGIPCKNN